MLSREVVFEVLTITRSALRVAQGSSQLMLDGACNFYRTSSLTKPLRVHDEMWTELNEKAQDIRNSELSNNKNTAPASSSSYASDPALSNDFEGKRPTINPNTKLNVDGRREYSTNSTKPKPVIINKNERKIDESRYAEIPSTKLQRLFHYGHLATSIGINAAADGIKAVVSGQKPTLKSVSLSSRNVSLLGDKLRKMRGAALKVGQMLSIQDESFLPREISDLLKSVQNQGYFMPPRQLHRILRNNFGENWKDNFKEFDEIPIASASISQVHKAVLITGEPVAVKIQYPGVKDSIDSDMDNLLLLLTASSLLPKGMFAENSIGNARTELKWECDFNREADSIKRFRELLKDDEVFVVPKVYDHLTNENIITMDFLEGIEVNSGEWDQPTKDWIATNIMRLCLQEIAQFKFMQTDPNWANFLYNESTKKIELLDFGASREYSDEFIKNYVTCLNYAVKDDFLKVKEYSKKLGYLTGFESEEMVEAHVESVITLGEPFRHTEEGVFDFSSQDVTNRVKAKMGLMLRERLTPPPEETYSLHRKFSGAFLLCTRLQGKVPCEELFQKYFKV